VVKYKTDLEKDSTTKDPNIKKFQGVIERILSEEKSRDLNSGDTAKSINDKIEEVGDKNIPRCRKREDGGVESRREEKKIGKG
jgi:hypothetical protein